MVGRQLSYWNWPQRIQSLPNHVAVDLASHPAIDSFLTDQTLTPHWKVTTKKIHPKIALYFSLVIIPWIPGAKKKRHGPKQAPCLAHGLRHVQLHRQLAAPASLSPAFPRSSASSHAEAFPRFAVRPAAASVVYALLPASSVAAEHAARLCRVLRGRLEKVGLYRFFSKKMEILKKNGPRKCQWLNFEVS